MANAKPQNIDPRNRFAPRRLPFIVTAVALAVYFLTLNHWVNLLNLNAVAKVAGWTWQPDQYGPMLVLITAPLHCLPAAWVPLALNGLSAICAALTLGLLARSVAILPHDRTEAERAVEKSDFSFLTSRSAWVPPALAVAMCGFHAGFWEHATNFTGEMIQLLVFAFIIWEILEFRLDERDSRLYWACFAYCAGMADDWALSGFLPFFLLALVWSKGVEFFHPIFLTRALLCSLAGATLYLFLPVVNLISHANSQLTFWHCLQANLRLDWMTIKTIANPDMRYNLGIISLTSVLPVFLLSIRWPESFGDSSRIGMTVSRISFDIVHIMVLGVCLWIMFDPPFSPSSLSLVNSPGLMFYFLSALSIGYYSGYLLLVFGRWAGRRQDSTTRPTSRRRLSVSHEKLLVQKTAILIVSAAGLVAVGVLIYKNLPATIALNRDILREFSREALKNLPAQGGILLGDSDAEAANQPWRMFAMQAELARAGRENQFIPVETQYLPWPDYQRYLHNKYPRQWPLVVSPQDKDSLTVGKLVDLIKQLSQTNQVYYLNASFGYYFEQFYQEPHGLVYQLKLLPASSLLPPPPSPSLINENEKFWQTAEAENFGVIRKALEDTQATTNNNLGEYVLNQLHISRSTPNQNANLISVTYSQALNFWGVQLQRSHELTKAEHRFSNATDLNPDNLVAQINLEFNRKLQSGNPGSGNLSEITSDQFGKYRSWNEVLNVNGPFDDPNFCFNTAAIYLEGSLLTQALAPLVRLREQVPDNLMARLWLGRLYVVKKMPDQALEAIHEPMADPGRFGMTPSRQNQFNIIAATAYFQKNNFTPGIKLMDKEIQDHPGDQFLAQTVAHVYVSHGLYTNALNLINRQLLQDSNNASWHMGKGYTLLQLKSYLDAEASFSRALEIQTNNYEALFNRGLAFLDNSQFAGARADFLRLQQLNTKSYPIAYGLSEVAVHMKDTNEVIRNCEIYLANAPTNTAEYKIARDRLAQWRRK